MLNQGEFMSLKSPLISPLFLSLRNKRDFALVALVGLALGLVFGHDRVLVGLGDDIKV